MGNRIVNAVPQKPFSSMSSSGSALKVTWSLQAAAAAEAKSWHGPKANMLLALYEIQNFRDVVWRARGDAAIRAQDVCTYELMPGMALKAVGGFICSVSPKISCTNTIPAHFAFPLRAS